MNQREPAVVVLRPGDRVLLALREEPDPEQAQAYLQALHEDFPGVSFTVVGGAAGLALYAGSPSDVRPQVPVD